MPCSKARARYSKLHEDQKLGFIVLEAGAMMQRSSGHSQFSLSCSIPKLWPSSCAMVVATKPITSECHMLTPPENS